MELKKQVISGSFWSVASNISVQAVNFVITVVLARLLVPEDFGVIAISSVVVGFVTLFQDLGMGSAIIQKKQIDEDYLGTSLLVSFVTGIAIALLIVAVSPFIASFYSKSILEDIIMVSSIGFVLGPLMSIHNSILTKNLEFKKIGILNVSSHVLSGGISIFMALTGFGVWSLVVGKLVAQLILIPVYWKIAKWTPKFRFRKTCFQELFAFSSNILGFNILNYFCRNSDNLIVGKYLGTTILGYYAIAYNLMLKPLQLISWSVGRVLFPTFSSMQDDKERIRAVYTKVVLSISLVTFPMMTGLMVVAKEFILATYGARWEPVVLPLQLLCLVGVVQSIGTTSGPILLSQGKSDLFLKLGIFKAVVSMVAFFVGIRWGLVGLIIGYMLATIAASYSGQHYAGRLIGLKINIFFRSMYPAFICSTAMAILLVGIKYIVLSMINLSNLVVLLIMIPTGALFYFALLKTYFSSEELTNIMTSIFPKIMKYFYRTKGAGAIP
jgi:PST family polysaccharide transporter